MTKGILLFCFDTPDTKYHKVLERCVELCNRNLRLEITVVTDIHTYKRIRPLGFINYKLIEPELGNTKNRKDYTVRKHVNAHPAHWHDVTRCATSLRYATGHT